MSKNNYWNISDWMYVMKNRIRLLTVLLLVTVVTACASAGGKIADHVFEFNIKTDSAKNIEVLEYKYGNSKILANSDIAKEGQPIYASHASGKMLVGDFLYVKWKYKPTKELIEKTVNLKSILPSDMNGKKIYLAIREKDLFVYLIHKDLRAAGDEENGPSIYWKYKVETIYPSKNLIYKFEQTYGKGNTK